MKSGDLDQRVTIERAAQGVDELGQPLDGWNALGSCWASVRPLMGREFISAQAVQSEVSTRVVIRYRPGITAADRVVHDGRIYNIVSVIEVRSANDELQLMCRG